MNFVKSNSLIKLRTAKNVFASQSAISSRVISTATPPLLQQPSNQVSPRHLLTPFSTPVRHIIYSGNTETGYEAKPPKNWGIQIVPEETAYIIERFGKFVRILTPGFHLLLPFVEKIAYVHSLKEEVIRISNKSVITRDNSFIQVRAIVHVKIVDPKLASYGIKNALNNVIDVAQMNMEIELSMMSFDKIFEKRDTLNEKIMVSINEEARNWGLKCLHFGIGNISPSSEVIEAMEMLCWLERR